VLHRIGIIHAFIMEIWSWIEHMIACQTFCLNVVEVLGNSGAAGGNI